MSDENSLKLTVEIPFSNPRLAEIAYQVLRVDKEPKRNQISKELNCKENILHATFRGNEARRLRVSVNAFFESVILIMQTMDFAGEPVSDSYSFY